VGKADPTAEGLADGVEEQQVPNRVANSQYALAPGTAEIWIAGREEEVFDKDWRECSLATDTDTSLVKTQLRQEAAAKMVSNRDWLGRGTKGTNDVPNANINPPV
jgi:hypothetical protein